MTDKTNYSVCFDESVVTLYNRLRKHGPSTAPEAHSIAASNRLVEHLLVAIDVWEAAKGKNELREQRGALTKELALFRSALVDLSDGIARMGGSATEERNPELGDAVADVDWSHDESALRAVLSHVRRELVRSCASVETSEPVSSVTRLALRRIRTALRPAVSVADDVPSF